MLRHEACETDPRVGPGTSKIYSDVAIQCALVLKSVFHLSLRATKGFLSSLIELMALELPVPDYTTVSRRQASLAPSLLVCRGDRPRHVVVDATGLRVYGEGEWHVRKHGSRRRRSWRKLHLGVDETTGEIVAVELTRSNVHDSRQLPALLSQVAGNVCQVSGDRAYDTRRCYESILSRGAVPTVPPRRNARERASPSGTDWRSVRNAARRFDSQRVEALIMCGVLNRMTGLGMPESVRI